MKNKKGKQEKAHCKKLNHPKTLPVRFDQRGDLFMFKYASVSFSCLSLYVRACSGEHS